MHRPSSALKRLKNTIIGDKDYIGGLQKNIDVANSIKLGMGTPFGAALYMAIEDLERDAYSNMANTSPLRIFRHYEIRNELRIVHYLKSTLDAYVINGEALEEQMRVIIEGEDYDRED